MFIWNGLERAIFSFSFILWEHHFQKVIFKKNLLFSSPGIWEVKDFLKKRQRAKGRLSASLYPQCIPPILDEKCLNTHMHKIQLPRTLQ